MGWSATNDACRTMEAIEDKCLKLTGTANAFVTRNRKFVIEIGDEQEDGSIRGDIIDYFTGTKKGDLHIGPDGDILEGTYIKRLMKNA